MLAVGLTGGIGAGKSALADLYVERGAALVDSDLIAREVVESGSPTLEALVQHFGAEILAGDGSLDRSELARLAFSDPEQIEALTKYCDDIQRPSDPHYCGDEAEGTAYDIARRLRRMLAPRRCPTCGLRPAPVIAKNARFTATIESAFGERFCEGHP